MLSATPHDHLILAFDKRLDETVPLSLADFTITVDGVPYTPDAGTYLYTGIAGLIDPTGSTFVRLDLPAGVMVGAASDIEVTYDPPSAPLRDLALTPAVAQTIAGDFLDPGPVAFLGGILDSANATNRVTLVFSGQVALGSIPAPGDFIVLVNGTPVSVLSVEPRMTDLGLGLVDLVLTSPVSFGAIVSVSYTPGTNPFMARPDSAVLDAIPPTEVTVLVTPTTASATVAAGGTISTGTGAPPTAADPLTTAVTSPIAGLVTIDETSTTAAPAGYTFFGEQVVITAPPASSVDAPLVLVFEVDATLVPGGQTAASIVVFRDGVPIAQCSGPVGSAIPAPCIAGREDLLGGGIRVIVATLAASQWNLGVVEPFSFGGFLPPVHGDEVRNLAKAGQAIPVRFSLDGDRGMNIFTAGSPTSQRVVCDTSDPFAVIQTIPAGASSLTYNPASDSYRYVWKTDARWAGSCRQLTLSFGDGSQQTALFQFK